MYRSPKQADRDPSSWLRPGWEWKTGPLQNVVKCLGCGFGTHRNQTTHIIWHEGDCKKFQGLVFGRSLDMHMI